ncbi:restriction endonuclease subunit S [Bradyrhizobium sp. 83012]|uniref:Restriction endonuclease subunit S n=1 Tax=Bradyrhizobium aeschynomenes TaxID=2734909 RepID=A0ABX2CBU4_9BRAD|nr:restriction endonuclease subunit S [Bradyrhizobium aeschynomenes]NPU64734.1 restriction endonuclease subunit S [Bradyrhizobium aeschynomenes]
MLERPFSRTGWTRVRFDQIATQINDRVDNPAEAGVERYVGLEHLDSDSLRIRRWGEPTDVESTKLRFQEGDIIFGKRRVYQRKVAVADFEGICSAHAMVLRAKPGVVWPEFLPFFMQSDLFMERALSISVGSLSPTINWKALAAEEFLLPPIQEQARLANVLKGVEATSEALRIVVNTARVLRQSTIDHFANLRNGRGVQLGSVCEMQNGRPFPGDEYQKIGPRLLRPGNLGPDGYLQWQAAATVRLPERYETEAPAFVVDAGDIVINLTAQSLEEGFMGRVCLAREGDRSLLNQRIGRFQSFASDFLPEFVYRILQSSRFQNHAIRMCEGSKIKHLFWDHLAPFSLPRFEIPEQRAVVSTIRIIDAQLEAVQARLSSAVLDRSRIFDQSYFEALN